ncbi:hypothetical protein OG830_37845 [Streptomyces sp. NBC_00121]|uniref:hypothetical protein n=1 Tax=unclassified Streptomyces TaxID=2593676 RepID=UPI0028C49D27|nr:MULTISPECIES: hypothetical protein [unclassified Streptomyces]WNO69097.1 hypothetical protein RPQ02_37495 [Streptomyces sp. AM2-3-1]WSC73877.1 hypothetical protein OG807_38520 [Streptomyces sp. NBC_01760]
MTGRLFVLKPERPDIFVWDHETVSRLWAARELDGYLHRSLAGFYTWTLELRRDNREELELYFFFGDPDSRSTYVLTRKQP